MVRFSSMAYAQATAVHAERRPGTDSIVGKISIGDASRLALPRHVKHVGEHAKEKSEREV